jgi:hypothetical protein
VECGKCDECGNVGHLQFYIQARFQDSAGKKTNFKPSELKGYGFSPTNDSLMVHFVSFADVEMQGSLGIKKEDVFLQRIVKGHAPLYYLFHGNYTGYTSAQIPEVYILDPKQPTVPCVIKPKALKLPTRYRKSDILPHPEDWPEEEYSKIHDELSFSEVVSCLIAYNLWKNAKDSSTAPSSFSTFLTFKHIPTLPSTSPTSPASLPR